MKSAGHESSNGRVPRGRALNKPAVSELVRTAHALEDAPGTPIEDPVQIKKLLGR